MSFSVMSSEAFSYLNKVTERLGVLEDYQKFEKSLHSYRMGTITREELQTMVIWLAYTSKFSEVTFLDFLSHPITLELNMACIEH